MLKNHPKGLMILFFTEMWERFGFYTMMAVYTLYMDESLMWDDAHKGDFYGLFLGAVYFVPIAGGWIGDKMLGYRKTIQLGAYILAIGYATLAFSSLERIYLFYLALILIAVGNGLFKSNMSVLVGNLYEENSKLKDVGYNIFYMGVNIGATLAPLAATVISNVYHSYNISFGAASAGMVIAIILFTLGKQKYIYADNNPTERAKGITKAAINNYSPKEERARIWSLVTLYVIVIFFWIGFYQNGFALTLFAQRSTIESDILKPETYQFFNPFFILVLTPLLIIVFNKLRTRGKEPSSPIKIFLGMLIMSCAMIVMVFASLGGGDLDTNIMSPKWLISTYFVVTLSEILVSPMGLSYVSKVSPARMRGFMMGFWFGATALGSYGSGLLGKYYSQFEHHEYFIILAALLLFAAILVLFFIKRLKRFSS